jgi:CRISPR-associated protein Csx10
MPYTLEITLISPLSPGSGEGWAGMIDSDVVFDEYGLPYIPARRIKGILREMAYDVSGALAPLWGASDSVFTDADVLRLFGNRGNEQPSPLRVENAYLNDYQQTREWLEWAKRYAKAQKPDAAPIMTRARVIDAFTHLRQQTAIENGIAQKGSLRTSRVLNRHQQFFSRVEISEPNTADETLLALAAGVMRALGGKRNRGLGQVQCRLLNHDNQDLTEKALLQIGQRFGVKVTGSVERGA